MVVSYSFMTMTGTGGQGSDSGEGALDIATTSTDGSRRVNCTILAQGCREVVS